MISEKRLEYQYFSTRHSVLYHHTRFFGSHISNFRLWQKRTSEVNRKSSALTNRSRKCRLEKADIKWMLIGWIKNMHVWIWSYSLLPLDFSQGEWCQSTLVLLKFLMSERLSVYLSIISLARFPSYVYHPFHPTLIIHPLHLWVLYQIYFFSTD